MMTRCDRESHDGDMPRETSAGGHQAIDQLLVLQCGHNVTADGGNDGVRGESEERLSEAGRGFAHRFLFVFCFLTSMAPLPSSKSRKRKGKESVKEHTSKKIASGSSSSRIGNKQLEEEEDDEEEELDRAELLAWLDSRCRASLGLDSGPPAEKQASPELQEEDESEKEEESEGEQGDLHAVNMLLFGIPPLNESFLQVPDEQENTAGRSATVTVFADPPRGAPDDESGERGRSKGDWKTFMVRSNPAPCCTPTSSHCIHSLLIYTGYSASPRHPQLPRRSAPRFPKTIPKKPRCESSTNLFPSSFPPYPRLNYPLAAERHPHPSKPTRLSLFGGRSKPRD
jgi:hypothetical protein